MDLGIAGRWALVGGASKGLGLGCAQALAREGVNVLMVARGAPALEAAAAALGGRVPAGTRVQTLACDITTVAGREAIFSLRRDFDIVVTNAGGPPPGDFRTWDRDAWIAAVDANMLTPIELIKATVDGMAARGFGRIVNITSSSVKAPIDILGLSNGARSGLTGFVAGLARSPLAGQGVTINNLLPGAFDTDRLRATQAASAAQMGKSVDEVANSRRQAVPARRFGNAEEFGQVCAFMCSVQAGYLTGQNILLDGGAYPGTF
jgi:3-oxoacyl-[acyl-carrier protein] reductase